MKTTVHMWNKRFSMVADLFINPYIRKFNNIKYTYVPLALSFLFNKFKTNSDDIRKQEEKFCRSFELTSGFMRLCSILVFDTIKRIKSSISIK